MPTMHVHTVNISVDVYSTEDADEAQKKIENAAEQAIGSLHTLIRNRLECLQPAEGVRTTIASRALS